ncbi:BnaAnng09900D [Brassica napus]|uniref:BnaAnng09900D protein n=1 Tax=Brassica napus TaxID=3708 RepID=A0A078IC69_BRANA|nr:BnaAnng09900D [Brassica napus]
MGRTEVFIRFRDDVTKVEKRENSSGVMTTVKKRSTPRLFRSAIIPGTSSPRRVHWRFGEFDLRSSTDKIGPTSRGRSPPWSRWRLSSEISMHTGSRSSFQSGIRGLGRLRRVGHPNLATYPEDWKESARIVALQKQDHWEDFTRERIQRSVERIASQHWISDSLPLINRSTLKRLSLFTRAEQKEINQARTMKQLPDLSLIAAGKIGAKKGTDDSAGVEITDAVPVTAERAPTGGSSQGKTSKKKRSKETRKESNEIGQTDPDNPSKKGSKKRKAAEPPAEDVPRKKKTKKQDFSVPRPSSVCEEELQALVPDATPEVGTSDDDENETIALRRRRREGLQQNRGALVGGQVLSETPKELPASERPRVPLRGDSSAHITEGSETRVSGRPKETPEDGFKFEFNRELPLACYPEDCARLLRLVKGGPDLLPSVGDLIFKDEYEQASCSSRKEKVDLERRMAAESLRHSEEMTRLRKSRRYEVTHERIRVLIAMIAKAEKRFHKISLREDQRDKYDDARCVYSQAFGTRKCLEQIKASGVEIPQETIDFFAGQERHYEEEAERLESRFLIEEIWRQLDPFGSNIGLIDSEAAIALRTPLADRDPRSADPTEKPAQTAVSSNQHTNQGVDPTERTSVGPVVQKDGAVPTIVLTDSSAKASKNASSSASSSEDPGKGDDLPTETPAANVTESIPTKFGRVSGPGEGDGSGDKDPPVVD